MEHSEAFASWNPALRVDDHEAPVATTQTAPDSMSPSPLKQDDPVPSATQPSNAESAESVVAAEAPSKSDEDILDNETRRDLREEAAEVLSTALGDDRETNISEVEPTSGDDNSHMAHENLAPEPQAEQTQVQVDASEHALQDLNGHHDAQWANQIGMADQPARSNGEIGATNHDFWGSPKSVDNGDDDFFDQLKTQTKPIYSPEAERFEEGVPLLDESAVPETPVEKHAPQPTQIDAVFDADEEDDDGFFSSVQKAAPDSNGQGPFHMHRKSTTEVMDSLGASQQSPTSPLSPTAEEFNSILAAAASQPPEEPKEPKEASQEEDLAARWQAELSDDDLAVAPGEDDLAARWQAELDDDDLLLEEETAETPKEPPSQMVNGDHAAQGLGSPFGTPLTSSRPKAPQNAYTPHQPSTSDLVQDVGVIPPTNNTSYAASYFQPRPDPPAPLNKAESFAERPKEGYKSPYDLPEDLAPRRKPAPKPVVMSTNLPAPPPPRSTSIPAPPTSHPSAGLNPAIGSHTAPTQAPAAPPAPKNFYEELPLPLPPVRPRSRPQSSGRYTPNPSVPGAAATQPPPPAAQPPTVPQLHPSGDSPQHPLQKPETLGPYTNLTTAHSAPVVPSMASRYSPKPPTLQTGVKPPVSPRYSPAPPAAAPPPPQRYVSQPSIPGQPVSLPFQPRTSSPLAHHEKATYQPQEVPRKSSLPYSAISEPTADTQQPQAATEPTVSSGSVQQQPHAPGLNPAGAHAYASASFQQSSPPRNPYAPPTYVEEFSHRVSHVESPSSYTPPVEPLVPPRRSQTQSPTQQQPAAPRLSVPTIDPLKRPASVHAPSSPTKAVNAYAPVQSSTRTRAISQSLEFIPPVDGQEFDPLQRWKGAPIIKFGFGGTVLSCFPKHVPRYSAGQATPKIKSTPGEIKTSQLKDWISFPESIVQHPGPLRNKSKKKDLVAWLSSKIAVLENEGVPEVLQTYPDSHKRHEEKVLLWKVVRVLVEHDGSAQPSQELLKSLRNVLFPNLQNAESDTAYGGSLQSLATSQQFNAASQPDAAASMSLGTIRDSLLLGEREKAVWNAVDSRLWGHAMIIASTLDKSIWKQVVQEFVRREVRSSTGNAESLAALYEVFAGNFEESIDELVPPSARAGLQMVSKVGGQGSSKDALAGLESWKDTLGLVLSNRSPDDHQALLALGRLLLSYGRVEAAHICLVFSRASVFGGPDDPQANIVLLGVDHVHSSPMSLLDDDAFLLTEAYEYATSVLTGSPTSTLPHLMAFKLVHAWSLVDRGQKSEAQQYCDAISAALKATTKPTGYHHQHLFFGVDELSARLKQTTGDGGSWISKPSMEKVSSSMWNKFSSFVAGDDSDAASTGSGKAGEGEIGPFAKISGTPTISRSPSVSDLYGQYPMPAAQPISSSAPSRYQPSNHYAPNSSPDQGRGRSSLDSQRSASFGFSYGQRRGSQEYTPAARSESPMYTGGSFYSSPSVGYQSTPPQTSYMPPLAPVEEDMTQQTNTLSTPAPQGLFAHDSPYQPPAQSSFGQSLDGVTPTPQLGESGGYVPPVSSTGYEPPSAVIDGPELEEESEEEKPRKKSIMDDEDEDELASRAEALKKAERARKDAEAEERFRKAAEEDAQKAKAGQAKSSWWPSPLGWLKGGNKEDNLAGAKPIRAKLGEENSFYYDKDLKKWVNKKDPNSATAARATPPPPKGPAPPSRSASGSSMPPPPAPAGSGSRPSSSAGAPPPPTSVPSSLGLPPTPSLGPARPFSTGVVSDAGAPSPGPPPLRPPTSLSAASSIDDLLAAPTARRGNAAKGRKKGRYVDVMAK
ncbi:Sec23-binding domain of Sec16-domain-containing protein [Aspergillus egyptiacus]|nr:Sec23-binding domain of Sec16-domain-containing protein [Aspergillus egyptiacus]